jgi:hypothetical protein
LTTVIVALVFSVTGCGDAFFTRPPEGELTADNFYNSQQDLRRATGALYNQVWFDWNNSAAFVIGDARAGTMWSTDTGYQQFIDFAITSENQQLIAGCRGPLHSRICLHVPRRALGTGADRHEHAPPHRSAE